MRSKELVRGISDGRLDLGIVRVDALPKHAVSTPLGRFGYSLFASNSLLQRGEHAGVEDLLRTIPLVQVLSGGTFEKRFAEWLEEREIQANTVLRVSSFVACAEAVRRGTGAAVLPDIAAGVLQGPSVFSKPIPLGYKRELAVVGNLRAMDRLRMGEELLAAVAASLQRT
jgi:DNA-binding transcriptional LysR family regulator